MERIYSLAYLTAPHGTAIDALRIAAETGYQHVGLRPAPNGAGGDCQALIGEPGRIDEVNALQAETGVGTFDLEIVRIAKDFSAAAYRGLMETGQAIGARAVLVAADDPEPARLADSYGRLCEAMLPYGLSADLEFMPWTAVRNAREALAVVRAAGEPANAGILIDALHFGRSDTSLDDIRAIPRRLLHYAQICDALSRPAHGGTFTNDELIHTARCERLLPGEGDIDLRGLFAALPADLPISVEIVNLERMRAVGDARWAADCLAATRALIESA